MVPFLVWVILGMTACFIGGLVCIYDRFYGKYREMRNTTLQNMIVTLPNSCLYEIFPFASSLQYVGAHVFSENWNFNFFRGSCQIKSSQFFSKKWLYGSILDIILHLNGCMPT